MTDICMASIILSGKIQGGYETIGKNANMAQFILSQTVSKKRGSNWGEEEQKWVCKAFIRDDNADMISGITDGAKVTLSGKVTPFWKNDDEFSGYSVWVDTMVFNETIVNNVISMPGAKSQEEKDPQQGLDFDDGLKGPEAWDDSDIPF